MAGVGGAQVCTTVFKQNFCTPKCTKDIECPVDSSATPEAGEPWAYLTCNVATGKCK